MTRPRATCSVVVELPPCGDVPARRLAADLAQCAEVVTATGPIGPVAVTENERQARALAAVPEPDGAEAVTEIGPVGPISSPANARQARAPAGQVGAVRT